MRTQFIGPIFGMLLSATSALAYDANDPRNCVGPDWDDNNVQVVSRVIAAPRVNFVKSPYDDDFKADTCPAATDACRRNAYLVSGDLVLSGKTEGGFTCVSYQSPTAKKQVWTVGWLPSSALTPVAPMASPKIADWIGTWADWSIELLDAREADGLVLATAAQRGRGKGSGAPMQNEVAFLFTLRAGTITRWQMFHSEREALEAVGLEG